MNTQPKLQRQTDKFVKWAREASSRGSSFLIVMLGVILQASHTTLLMYHVAAFESEALKIIVSLGIGIFISCALAIFTLKYDGKDKKVYNIIRIFFWFELFTNVFYYWNSLIFSKGFDNAVTQDWLYLIIAMPFSFIMPYAIKQFADIINADEKLAFGDIDTPETEVLNTEEVSELQEQLTTLQEKLNAVSNDFIKKDTNLQIDIAGKKAVIKLGDVSDTTEHNKKEDTQLVHDEITPNIESTT